MNSVAASTAGLVVRPCGPTDEAAILALLRQTLSAGSAYWEGAQHWRWKHDRNPFGASYRIGAFEPDTGELVSSRALMWWTYEHERGERIRAARTVDTATHPEYRRRGIFARLTEAAVEELRHQGAAFIFNTPNANSLPGYLKLGWKEVARWTPSARPIRLSKLVHSLLGSPRAEVSLEEIGMQSWGSFRANWGREVDGLVLAHESRRRRTGLRTPRDAIFLDWRYGAQPHVEYGVHAMTRGGRLRGFLVARPARGWKGLPVLVVTEAFVWEPSTAEIARLLQSFSRTVRVGYLLAQFGSDTLEGAALRRRGFFRLGRKGRAWAVRPLAPVVPDPTVRSSWDLTYCEIEIF